MAMRNAWIGPALYRPAAPVKTSNYPAFIVHPDGWLEGSIQGENGITLRVCVQATCLAHMRRKRHIKPMNMRGTLQ
ncbi:hypothetical protein KXR69_20050 [Ralstonia holmesii]